MIDLPRHARGLVFDCDGTLVDTMPLHKRLWDEMMAEQGVELPPGFIDAHTGKPTTVIVEILNRERGLAIDPLEFRERKEQRFRSSEKPLQPIAPVFATARHYLEKLPMAVVSGGCRANVEHSLRSVGAWDWFPVVLTADDPITPKPAPDLFLQAAKRIGVPAEECHAFEDGDTGIAAARAAGMSVTDVRLL